MEIAINLPHVFCNGASPVQNAKALRRFLDLMVGLNVDYLQANPRTKPLYRSGVVYQRTVIWEPIPALYARGYGDCKSLATAKIAEYKVFHGIDCIPVFRFIPLPDGHADFHILLNLPGFKSEDPSKILGMGEHEIGVYFDQGSYGSMPVGSEIEKPKLKFSLRRWWMGK